jgi:hypothetical protein
MGDILTTMSAILLANLILLPFAAYGCVRVGLLPGVQWYWPFARHQGAAAPTHRPRKGAAVPPVLGRGSGLR